MINKELEAAFERGIWAIVITPGGKYIGQLYDIEDSSELHSEDEYLERLTVGLRFPLEFASMFVPKQVHGPNGQPMMAYDRIIQAYPISRCYDVEKLEIAVQPVDLIFFNRMSRNDRDWHKDLIRAGIRGAVEARIRASGLLVPSASTPDGHA
jgi:hypothetical protein